MIKEVVFDADGVVLNPYTKSFSQRLIEAQGVSPNLVTDFFDREYKLCVTGKMNLSEALIKYIDLWQWNGTIDELMKFWFEPEGKINTGVLNTINNLRNNNIKTALATDKSLIHSRYILDDLGLSRSFDEVFLSCELGVRKSELGFWSEVIRRTGLEPKKIQFWDDDLNNVEIAMTSGIDARLFTGFKSFRVDLRKTLGPAGRS